MTEELYHENGFDLVVYQQRKPDPYIPCPNCGKQQYHVATVYEEWENQNAATTYYYYCKNCKVINRQDKKQRPTSIETTEHTFDQQPHELLVELLATARRQEGRGVSILTINKHWWVPRRYPLARGEIIEGNRSHVRPKNVAGEPGDHRLVDHDAPRVTPMDRYEPLPEPPTNPFTSRQNRSQLAEKSEVDEVDQATKDKSKSVESEGNEEADETYISNMPSSAPED